jgi:hypothetical protein
MANITIYKFEGTALIEISDPGCGCQGCFFNKYENCGIIREKNKIPRCSLSHSIFIKRREERK